MDFGGLYYFLVGMKSKYGVVENKQMAQLGGASQLGGFFDGLYLLWFTRVAGLERGSLKLEDSL